MLNSNYYYASYIQLFTALHRRSIAFKNYSDREGWIKYHRKHTSVESVSESQAWQRPDNLHGFKYIEVHEKQNREFIDTYFILVKMGESIVCIPQADLQRCNDELKVYSSNN